MEITDILVPIDFGSSSVKSLEYALSLAAPDGEIYLLHVIDSDFVEKAARNELGSAEAVTEKLRQLADRELDEIIAQNSESSIKLSKMIVVGIPFVEILRIANDLDFSLIVMGIRGKRDPIREIFFGSTADRTLRATRIPIVCVPL